MGYDHWKATNPADEFLGPEPLDEELVGLYGEEALELAGMDQAGAKARRVAAAIALEHHHFHQQPVWSDGMLRSAARLIAEALKDHPSDDDVGGTGAF